mmetsp:Transcript_23402/g.70395  ORF Transcript_23402/g.70395 Transcript_23402/m.70395 type:complete len:642 (-) Transcript_23402:1213-3138(-)
MAVPYATGPSYQDQSFDGDEGHANFWKEFIKTDEAQDAMKQQYRDEFDQAADEYENKVKPQELRDLAEALLDCSREIKHIVAPLLKYDFCQRTLYNILQDCTSGKDASGAPREKKNFSDYLMTHGVRYQMEKLAEDVRANPAYGKTVNDEWWASVCQKMADDNKRDMFDHPRYIDVQGLCSMMNQGGLCLDMGMAKWKEKNYELALERYTLGVDMLQNLRARGRENEELLAGVTCRLLKNQAACALKLELWGLAARACDKVLHFKPRDVKALYRKGVAGARLGRVDGAVVDLQKALKLEPANRDAKRELARLTDIVRRKRLEEKKRFSGGLQRATSKGLYGDKEAEREKKKKLEAQASAKKRARHEKFNAARKEKGEDEVTFENWEKEEKEKAEKEEKAAEEARRRQQRQREEQRRKERGEDRVVVDDDLDLANCKGYKTLADGRRTSYFTNVPDQTTAQLLAAQQAPKKLEGGAAPSPDSNGDGSAWNAAGTTFEERDMKGWADDALRDALRDVSSVTDGLSVKTTSVKKLTGEASLVVSRGRARHIFEYVADLSVECRLPGEAPPGPGATTIKGTLHMPEVSSSITDGQYEARFLRKSSSPSLSRPREAALEAAVAAYSDAVRAAVAAFVADFSEKRIK